MYVPFLHSFLLTPFSLRMSGRVLTETAPKDTVGEAFEVDGLVVTTASSLTNLLEEEEEVGTGECAGGYAGREQELPARGVENDDVATPPIQPRPPSHKRLLPTPPSGRPVLPPRPCTVADFRVRRLRRHLAEVSLESQGMLEAVDQTQFDSAELRAADLGKEVQWSETELV